MLNSPHAYNQNKAFTKHIVDAKMQSFEEKLELEVSIPRKLYDEGNLLLRLRFKTMSAMLCVNWVLVFPRFPKTLCDVLGFREFDDCSLNLHLADSTI